MPPPFPIHIVDCLGKFRPSEREEERQKERKGVCRSKQADKTEVLFLDVKNQVLQNLTLQNLLKSNRHRKNTVFEKT